MDEYVYKFVPFIPKLKLGVFGPQNAAAISAQLEALVSHYCASGWTYVRLEQVSVVHSAGCLASLLGAKSHTVDYDLVVFRAPGESQVTSAGGVLDSSRPASQPSTPVSPPATSSVAPAVVVAGAGGDVRMRDGRVKQVDAMDIAPSLKHSYAQWAANPEDVALWARFLKTFTHQEANLPHGQGAAQAVGSFFPAAAVRPEFIKLLDNLER